MSLSRDGVETRLNTTVAGAHKMNGAKLIDAINEDLRYSIPVDEIVLTTGRVPNVEELGLEAAGVDCEPTQDIKVDDFLRTTNHDIYAAGDVCKALKFTNVAEASARLAVRNALGGKTDRQSHLAIPWCTYCDPEIAHVGMHVREARRRAIPVKSYTVMMQDVDRAITDGKDDGFVKIYVRDGTDSIMGATIVASRASELINEVSVIMSAGIGMRQLANIIHTYPAQSDAIRLAALAYMGNQPDFAW
jgi:pyruvate/2-oxoglutarate dehydrogenase complex dihydrolipoamide dehydrogenase (E3) component